MGHPFPGKVTAVQADEIRDLRCKGVSLAEIARRYGISKSSACSITHFHAHVPPEVLRIRISEADRALLEEIAEDEDRPVEAIASEILRVTLRERAW